MLKLLLQLAVETSSLWRYVFRSVVRNSIQTGSSPCVYVVSCNGASKLLVYNLSIYTYFSITLRLYDYTTL
jgi:hypothetical protein